MKFRKKPVVIDATQFDPREHVKNWAEGVYTDKESPTGFSIGTLEGKHEVTPGDWIITGVKGEYYPVKDEIFKATYDLLQPMNGVNSHE